MERSYEDSRTGLYRGDYLTDGRTSANAHQLMPIQILVDMLPNSDEATVRLANRLERICVYGCKIRGEKRCWID